MDFNQIQDILVSKEGLGGGIVLLVIRYMISHARQISQASIEMAQAIKGHDKSIDELKQMIADGFKAGREDISSLRKEMKEEVRAHEDTMHGN